MIVVVLILRRPLTTASHASPDRPLVVSSSSGNWMAIDVKYGNHKCMIEIINLLRGNEFGLDRREGGRRGFAFTTWAFLFFRLLTDIVAIVCDLDSCLLDWMTGLLLLSAIRSKHSRWGINWALNKRPYPLPTHSHAPLSSVLAMKCFEGEKDYCDRCDEVDLKYTRDAFKTEIFIQNINHTRFHPVQLNTNNQPISCIIYKMYPRTQEAGSQPVRYEE